MQCQLKALTHARTCKTSTCTCHKLLGKFETLDNHSVSKTNKRKHKMVFIPKFLANKDFSLIFSDRNTYEIVYIFLILRLPKPFSGPPPPISAVIRRLRRTDTRTDQNQYVPYYSIRRNNIKRYNPHNHIYVCK